MDLRPEKMEKKYMSYVQFLPWLLLKYFLYSQLNDTDVIMSKSLYLSLF